MIAALTLGILGGLTVELPPAARVRGAELRLGDVATVSGEDEVIVRKARALVLGQTPAPGYTRQLLRADIVRELGFALEGAEVTLQGAPLTRVTLRTQVLGVSDQVDAARQALRSVFRSEDVELDLKSSAQEISIPEPRDTYSLRPRTQTLRPVPGPQGVAVDVIIDGAIWRTLWTSWEVQVYELWPVLRASVRKGETLTSAHFETRRVRVGSGRISSPLSAKAYGTAEAARTLEAGYVVLEEDVTRAWTVERGDACQLEVRSGGVSATVRAEAMANGRTGDRVALRIDSNQRQVVATVMGKGHLMLDMTMPPKPKPENKPAEGQETTPAPKPAPQPQAQVPSRLDS